MSPKLTLQGQKETWYPASIDNLKSHLEVFIVPCDNFTNDKIYPIVRNLSYTLQYIEFLYQVILDVKLSEVLKKQNIKSFVIHGASVIETIFQYIVIRSGNGNTTYFKSLRKVPTSDYKIGSNTFKNTTEIFIKQTDPTIERMTFDTLAKKVEKKKLLGNVNPQFYKKINHIRQLRNKVHLHESNGTLDTDFNSFNESKLKLMCEVLYEILTSEIFKESKNSNIFDYLKNNNQEVISR